MRRPSRVDTTEAWAWTMTDSMGGRYTAAFICLASARRAQYTM